jgi:hypothetical protein
MSAQSFSPLPRDQQVLGELLHSLSQPLTSLRCSLELSIEEMAEQQQQTVAAALEQTETVISMIQLMREYLETEQAGGGIPAIPLMPVLRSVSREIASVAAVRDVGLRVVGTCTAELPLAEPRLRLALEYLIQGMVERQRAGSEITLLLSEGPAGAMLQAQGERGFGNQQGPNPEKNPGNPQPKRDATRGTMQRVRLAIAARVLKAAGATLVLDDRPPGFVLRIPRLGDTADVSPVRVFSH